jgi:putative membrane protein
MRLLVRWLISTVALLIVAQVVPGFQVRGFTSALIAAAVIGLVNATLGIVIKVLTFPLTILTLGLFLIIVNAAMLKVAAYFVPGFHISGWLPAILGAIVLSLVSGLLHWIVGDRRVEQE